MEEKKTYKISCTEGDILELEENKGIYLNLINESDIDEKIDVLVPKHYLEKIIEFVNYFHENPYDGIKFDKNKLTLIKYILINDKDTYNDIITINNNKYSREEIKEYSFYINFMKQFKFLELYDFDNYATYMGCEPLKDLIMININILIDSMDREMIVADLIEKLGITEEETNVSFEEEQRIKKEYEEMIFTPYVEIPKLYSFVH